MTYHAKMLLFPMRFSSGGYRLCSVTFAAYFILRGRDMHIDRFSAVIVSGQCGFPSDVITFYLNSFETQSSSLQLNKLTSQAPEDAMLKIRRPVYKRLLKLHARCW